MKHLRVFLLVLFASMLAYGQEGVYKFRHYTINDGLVQSSVSSILQDSYGFVWFGSTGLSKFDGYRFTNFINHSGDSTSLINNMVQVLFEDSKGNLWIGTRAGLCIFDRDNNNFYSPLPNKFNLTLNVTTIAEDGNGIIYIGTYGSGLVLFNPVTKEKTIYTYNKDNPTGIGSAWISTIMPAGNNKMWIGTYHGLNLYDEKTRTFTRYNRTLYTNADWGKDAIMGVAIDSDGFLWIGSVYGIARFDTNTKTFTDFVVPPASMGKGASINIRSIAIAQDNQIWAGTQNGIIVLNTKTKKTVTIKHQPNDFESLAADEIECVYVDKNNDLWVGTRASGADKLKFANERFYLFKNTYPGYKELSSNEIYGMTEDKNGKIWIATLNGLNKFDPKTKKFKNYLKKNIPGIISDYQWTVYTSKKILNDLLWIGTDAGMFAFSISKERPVNPFRNKGILDSLKLDRILGFCLDNENNLWIGAETGLIKINLKTEKMKRYLHSQSDPKSISANYIWRLFTDSKGNLWIGTTNGLNCLKPGSDEFINYRNIPTDPNSLSNNEVTEIFQDKAGTLWVGTSDGLNKFDYSTGKFHRMKFENLASETIYSIQEDKKGFFWIGTAKGLVKYDPADGHTITYDVEDGLQSNEFNFPSLISETGEFYFTGINGFNVFNPANIKPNLHIPPVYITGFSILNKAVRVGQVFNERVIFKQALEDTKEITLNYDENIISIQYAALDYQSPTKNMYMYRMEGYDTEWVDAGNRRFVTYNLEPGTYVFKVKGANDDKIWNEAGCTLTIKILPPWWKTFWFRLLVVLAVISILYLIFYYRTKYLKNQKIHLEKLVDERTSELAQQQEIVSEQADKIQQANFELEQLNTELEKRVAERTAELEKAKEKAEKADQIKSEFLAQMSHEIRSPINVVLSFSNLIKSEIEDKINDDLKEGFKSISNAGKRIIRTVDLLLNMSEIQTQTYEYIPEQWDLVDDIIHSVLPEYQLTAKEKKLWLSIENNTEKSRIIGDSYTLEQIFANLLDNAVKYTNTGSITIKAYNNPAGLIICEIKDTGIGMSPEFMEKIFNPFTQEEQGYTRKYEGNGLGLALVKKYCELNGIDISVKSRKGEGTSFILKFNRTI